MPNNYGMALKRLANFEHKLNKDVDLKYQVIDHISNMLHKGYIRKLNEEDIMKQHPRKWYLSIFVVQNPNKPEKIRIVWDAAATYNGVSLNGCLNKGPDLPPW